LLEAFKRKEVSPLKPYSLIPMDDQDSEDSSCNPTGGEKTKNSKVRKSKKKGIKLPRHLR